MQHHEINLEDQIANIINAPQSFFGSLPVEDEETRESEIAYIASMYRKAKTHSAKNYEFDVNVNKFLQLS